MKEKLISLFNVNDPWVREDFLAGLQYGINLIIILVFVLGLVYVVI